MIFVFRFVMILICYAFLSLDERSAAGKQIRRKGMAVVSLI